MPPVRDNVVGERACTISERKTYTSPLGSRKSTQWSSSLQITLENHHIPLSGKRRTSTVAHREPRALFKAHGSLSPLAGRHSRLLQVEAMVSRHAASNNILPQATNRVRLLNSIPMFPDKESVTGPLIIGAASSPIPSTRSMLTLKMLYISRTYATPMRIKSFNHVVSITSSISTASAAVAHIEAKG
jgi:hypothetical protein